jgi:starch-binding outer membrane protein, SusD/RagB family
MKHIHIKTFIGAALMTLFLMACSDILTETPRATYTPEYFKTESGVMGGLTSMYAHLRYIFGQGYYDNSCVTGTDEATYATSDEGNFSGVDCSGITITSSTYPTSILWNNMFSNINTASGIIENAAAVGISDALIAEARFFRAFDYFYLVRTYGGVPLDLGSGELKFNSSPSRTSVRNTVPEVYTKGIFPDLLLAVENLPETGRLTGTVTKTAARLFLAKAYLTYAWWLENPNSIATYPECDRTDPDGHNAAWYYQQAYDVATKAIDNPGSFSLQNTFYDVNVGSNDRNSEIVLYSDRTETSEYYNASNISSAAGGSCDQIYGWFLTWNYTAIRSSSSSTTWTAVSSVQREAEQHLGRPWTRMCPTIGAITNTFADKTNDSRYDGTFVTVYRGNWAKGGNTSTNLYGANFLPVSNGDAILTFLNEENSNITYPSGAGDSNVGAGVLPGRADFVIAPSGISRIVYPGFWKIGEYRTDNGTGLGVPNAASTRPFPIAKFSELYFIAAEAAVKGATTTAGKTAYDLINVIRARAGKWSFDNNGNVAKVEDHSAEMVAATPTTITIDYILAERSREYFGEGYRWYDLTRTQKWADIAGTYQICGKTYGSHTPATVTRTIDDYLYLRPIPSGQLDGLEMTDEEKDAYQNPGYE